MWVDLPAANKNPAQPPQDWGVVRYSAKAAYNMKVGSLCLRYGAE